MLLRFIIEMNTMLNVKGYCTIYGAVIHLNPVFYYMFLVLTCWLVR